MPYDCIPTFCTERVVSRIVINQDNRIVAKMQSDAMPQVVASGV